MEKKQHMDQGWPKHMLNLMIIPVNIRKYLINKEITKQIGNKLQPHFQKN